MGISFNWPIIYWPILTSWFVSQLPKYQEGEGQILIGWWKLSGVENCHGYSRLGKIWQTNLPLILLSLARQYFNIGKFGWLANLASKKKILQIFLANNLHIIFHGKIKKKAIKKQFRLIRMLVQDEYLVCFILN